jgi:cytoskeletal protein CcmA (bactofilin family)
MSRLSANASFSSLATTAMPGAEFEVSVLPVSVDPADTRRYIVAKGYAPTKASPRRIARRLEQQVDLLATDGFRYALFTAPGGIAGANKMTVNGDVYSAGALSLSNNATVNGSVTSLGAVTTANNSTIAGDVAAGGNVTLNNASTTVLGNVAAGGNATLTGHVKGSVQAAGTISGGTVDGSRAANSPPPPPATQTLPAFTWNPSNYPSVSNWATPGAFQTYWSAHTGAFSGAHRVGCPAPCTTAIDLGSKWTVTGDTTLVADGPISLSRDVANGAGRPVTLTIVSLAPNGATPPIAMSNNVTLPDDVRVVFYAPNGPVKFTNLKHFTGSVYAASITLDQQFTLTFQPVTVAGFDFGPTSSSHFRIQAGAFKEVPYS